ncbi:hypothetical protein HK099_001132 [Clydaea vesicula]|uniref:Amino acid permease/ SLC12A domain-containing protein n=1 Tax=Clydaea vesicula TaxID=447962 RepID=A0AAD5U7R2_9FUNG|nr:hypothetical protein HK099_001132 [Clydaea vesicula]
MENNAGSRSDIDTINSKISHVEKGKRRKFSSHNLLEEVLDNEYGKYEEQNDKIVSIENLIEHEGIHFFGDIFHYEEEIKINNGIQEKVYSVKRLNADTESKEVPELKNSNSNLSSKDAGIRASITSANGVAVIAGKKGSWWEDYKKRVIYCNDYPDDLVTIKDVMKEYFNRRKLPKFKANIYHLFGLGVASVISGEFAGWSTGLATAGYYGFCVASLIASAMFLFLAGNLAEMSGAMPVVGGSFAYARLIVNDSFGFLLGHSENLEYLSFITLLTVSFGEYCAEFFHIDHYTWAPLLWLLFLIPGTYIVAYHNKTLWNMMFAGSVVCLLQIAGFSLFAIKYIDEKYILEGTSKHVAHHNIDKYWGLGLGGILQALHSTSWWYTGFECLTLAAHETADPVVKNVTKSLYLCWGALSLCAVLLTLTNVLVPPGMGTIISSIYPMVESILAITKIESKAHYFILFQLPALWINLLAMLWCATRQTWALSRAGYIPKLLSITSVYENRVPRRSLYFVIVYVIWMTFTVHYLHLEGEDLHPVDALLALCVISATVFYVGVSIVYLYFSMRYKAVPRPYVSPFGKTGAWFVIIVGCLLILAKIGLSHIFQLTVAIYCIKMFISAIFYYGHAKMHLLPTEEAITHILWQAKEKNEKKIPKFIPKILVRNRENTGKSAEGNTGTHSLKVAELNPL